MKKLLLITMLFAQPVVADEFNFVPSTTTALTIFVTRYKCKIHKDIGQTVFYYYMNGKEKMYCGFCLEKFLSKNVQTVEKIKEGK